MLETVHPDAVRHVARVGSDASDEQTAERVRTLRRFLEGAELPENAICGCGWSAPCECGDGTGVADPVISIATVRRILDGQPVRQWSEEGPAATAPEATGGGR